MAGEIFWEGGGAGERIFDGASRGVFPVAWRLQTISFRAITVMKVVPIGTLNICRRFSILKPDLVSKNGQ